MSWYRRKPDQSKRLPFWPSIESWSSCSFLSSEQIKHSQTCWMEWEKQLDFSERSYKQNWDGHLPLSQSGWHLPLFAELFFFFSVGVGEWIFTPAGLLFPPPLHLLLLLLLRQKKVFIFPFSFWSLYFRDGKSYIAYRAFTSARSWHHVFVSYNECLVYCICNSICLGKTGLHFYKSPAV